MELRPADRVVVAADFKPTHTHDADREVRDQVIALARDLSGTGVFLKINSALRACGYELVARIKSYGLKVFADLKLNDIPNTLETDGALLEEYQPELLTVMCATGVDAMRALTKALPGVQEILGVTALTSLSASECHVIYGTSNIGETVLRLGKLAQEAPIHGLISSPAEVGMLRSKLDPGIPMTYNTPAIRPAWSIVAGDDQNPERIMTPQKAIHAGATRIIVGRPILQAKNRRDAVLRTIAEVTTAVAA